MIVLDSQTPREDPDMTRDLGPPTPELTPVLLDNRTLSRVLRVCSTTGRFRRKKCVTNFMPITSLRHPARSHPSLCKILWFRKECPRPRVTRIFWSWHCVRREMLRHHPAPPDVHTGRTWSRRTSGWRGSSGQDSGLRSTAFCNLS